MNTYLLVSNFGGNKKTTPIGATFADVRWLPATFPEMAVAEADVHTTLFNHTFDWPFYIEAMTGGSNLTAGQTVNSQACSAKNWFSDGRWLTIHRTQRTRSQHKPLKLPVRCILMAF